MSQKLTEMERLCLERAKIIQAEEGGDVNLILRTRFGINIEERIRKETISPAKEI